MLMMHKNSLTEIKMYDRTAYICNLCRNKKVLHLGATDAPYTKEAIASDRFLHGMLTNVCQEVVGMDIEKDMIDWLQSNHAINNIKHGNIENPEDYPEGDFDFILAGEIFEHLSNPGKALDAIHKITKHNTRFIITVPNAYSLKGFARASVKYELIHPDHILHHSSHTLKTLMERHGFKVETTFSFVNGGSGIFASVTNMFLHFYPQLAEGIGVVCLPH
jgi:SAM-dependent methyltransferase